MLTIKEQADRRAAVEAVLVMAEAEERWGLDKQAHRLMREIEAVLADLGASPGRVAGTGTPRRRQSPAARRPLNEASAFELLK